MTSMYNRVVPDKGIANKSGHRSLDGLRAYEHLSSDIDKAARLIIADPTKCFEDVRREQEAGEEPSPTIPHEEPPMIPTQHVPGFSGLNNCTITFNITYGKKD